MLLYLVRYCNTTDSHCQPQTVMMPMMMPFEMKPMMKPGMGMKMSMMMGQVSATDKTMALTACVSHALRKLRRNPLRAEA